MIGTDYSRTGHLRQPDSAEDTASNGLTDLNDLNAH